VDGDRLPVVKTEVAVALTDAFAAVGIEIPFPQREVRLVEREKGA
jgi:small-conductance mechanosensitive channel